MLLPLRRQATSPSSVASKLTVRLELPPSRTCSVCRPAPCTLVLVGAGFVFLGRPEPVAAPRPGR